MVTCILDKDNGFNITNRRAHTHVPFHLNKNTKTTFDIWALNIANSRAQGKLNETSFESCLKESYLKPADNMSVVEKLTAESLEFKGHEIE